MGWGLGLLRDRNVDQGGTGSVDYKPDGTGMNLERKLDYRKERKLGLKRVGDTQLKPKSWVGAWDCRGTGTWTREGKEAGQGRGRTLD